MSYSVTPPRETENEAIREGVTYSVSLYVKLRLREEDNIKDEEIYMGELPLVSERGSFIINGAERVIVSQLHRRRDRFRAQASTPRVRFCMPSRIIPDRGAWLEFEFDQNDLLYVYLDRPVEVPAYYLAPGHGIREPTRIIAESFLFT